jgi:hypothetical protein
LIQENANAVATADKKAMNSWEKSMEGVLLWGEFSGGVEQALDAPWPWDEDKANAAKTPSLKQKKPLSAKQAAQLKHNDLIAAELDAKSQKVGENRMSKSHVCTRHWLMQRDAQALVLKVYHERVLVQFIHTHTGGTWLFH